MCCLEMAAGAKWNPPYIAQDLTATYFISIIFSLLLHPVHMIPKKKKLVQDGEWIQKGIKGIQTLDTT